MSLLDILLWAVYFAVVAFADFTDISITPFTLFITCCLWFLMRVARGERM